MRNQCAVGVEVHQQQLTIAATRTADRSSTLNRRLILCTMIAHPPQSHMQHAASRHTFKFFFPFSARMRTTSCPHPSILHAKDGTRGAHAPSRKRAEGWSLLFGRQAAGNGKQKPMTQRAPNMRAGACKEKKKNTDQQHSPPECFLVSVLLEENPHPTTPYTRSGNTQILTSTAWPKARHGCNRDGQKSIHHLLATSLYMHPRVERLPPSGSTAPPSARALAAVPSAHPIRAVCVCACVCVRVCVCVCVRTSGVGCGQDITHGVGAAPPKQGPRATERWRPARAHWPSAFVTLTAEG